VIFANVEKSYFYGTLDFRFRYSFICQGTSTRRQSQAATCYYQSNHSKVEAIPLSALPKDITSELAGLSP